MNKVLVSVIIPIYNVEKYISSAIQSVLNQSYTYFELLIVDDGSPDNSVESCQQFTDSRIKLIRQSNRGLAGARNTGIRHAQGEYIGFLDGDDLWQPNKLERHIEHLDSSPNVGVSFSLSAFIDDKGEFLGNYVIAKTSDITLRDLFCTNPVGNGSAPVFRRAALDDIQFQSNRYGIVENFFYDEDLRRSEDHEILLRIKLQSHWNIEGIPEALTLYRVNSSGLSANLWQQMESWEQVLAKVSSYAPDITMQWYTLALAYQSRYLARNAIRLRFGSEAVVFINLAIKHHWQILLEEPHRTLRIILAAYTLKFLPKSIYLKLEKVISKQMRKLQEQTILDKSLNNS